VIKPLLLGYGENINKIMFEVDWELSFPFYDFTPLEGKHADIPLCEICDNAKAYVKTSSEYEWICLECKK
jgi:hypothetical protein